jgi:hypothetical protein
MFNSEDNLPKKSIHSKEYGFVCSCKNNLTGKENVLYDTDVDEKYHWVISCISHAKSLSQSNKTEAKKLLKKPELWCSGCKELEEIIHAEKLLNNSCNRPDEEQLKSWAKIAKGNPEKCEIFEKIYGLKPDLFW